MLIEIALGVDHAVDKVGIEVVMIAAVADNAIQFQRT